MESLDKMTKKQLIEFFKKCRQPTFGNEPQLVRRARGAKKLGLDLNNDRPSDNLIVSLRKE